MKNRLGKIRGKPYAGGGGHPVRPRVKYFSMARRSIPDRRKSTKPYLDSLRLLHFLPLVLLFLSGHQCYGNSHNSDCCRLSMTCQVAYRNDFLFVRTKVLLCIT